MRNGAKWFCNQCKTSFIVIHGGHVKCPKCTSRKCHKINGWNSHRDINGRFN
jgi:uncharacterized Zn finger protein (UPF0148 family)